MVRILCVTPSLTSRAIREMTALRKKGHKIDLAYWGIGNNVGPTDIKYAFDSTHEISKSHRKIEHYALLFPLKFKRFFKETETGNYDIIHTYSNFDTLTIAAKEYTRQPVIYDVRDMTTLFSLQTHLKNYVPPGMRGWRLVELIAGKLIMKKLEINEKSAFEISDGVVFTSEYMRDLALGEKGYNVKEHIVLPNYLPSSFLPEKWPEKYSKLDGKIHIAYVGFLSLSGYRNILPTLKFFARDDMVLHIYGDGTPDALNTYKQTSAKNKNFIYEGKFALTQLIYEIAKNDVGLIPFFPHSDPEHIHSILPNKLFDYLAAGIPILSAPSKALKDFIMKHHVGRIFQKHHLKDRKSLFRIIEELLDIKINRNDFLMDTHIKDLENFYQKIIVNS